MTARAEGTNAPLRREEKKALGRIEARKRQLVANGTPEAKAEEMAKKEARDNPRKDFRRPR